MKLDNLSFRKLDQKWIAIDRKKDIKKINKILKRDFSYEPILGYVYISHEKGIVIRIVGHVTKENNQYFLEEEVLKNKLDIVYDEKINFHITFLLEDVTKNIKGTKEVENDIKVFYENNAIIDSRKEEILDDFRHEYFPDDLEILLTTKDDEEYLWGRIDAYSPKHKVIVCTLISDSIYNEEYKEGTQVFVKVEENNKDTILKIDKPTKGKE